MADEFPADRRTDFRYPEWAASQLNLSVTAADVGKNRVRRYNGRNGAVRSLPPLAGTTMCDSSPPKPKRRWYHLPPDRFLVALLLAEGFLLLCDR